MQGVGVVKREVQVVSRHATSTCSNERAWCDHKDIQQAPPSIVSTARVSRFMTREEDYQVASSHCSHQLSRERLGTWAFGWGHWLHSLMKGEREKKLIGVVVVVAKTNTIHHILLIG